MCQHEPGTGRSPGTFIFIFLLLFQIFLLFMVILQVISEGLDICPFHVSLLILPPSLYTTQVSVCAFCSPGKQGALAGHPWSPTAWPRLSSPHNLSAQNFFYPSSLPTKHSFAIPFPQGTFLLGG